ncbi:MAG: transposase [Candidatus Nitrotoga sp.]
MSVLLDHYRRYGAMVTTLNLPALEIWRFYRGRADCENRIKELKADLSLDSFNINDFYATEATLGFAMLLYNLMSLFRQAVLRGSVQHTLVTLHHKVFAVGAFWRKDPDKRQLNLAVSQRRRAWFEEPGLMLSWFFYPTPLPLQGFVAGY